ncbi:hypothetical protein NE237_030371 [Protea cynaroides]|uniref:Uncharacterized protein n=1 Tax=Protea cynaroides TaxID=273540 RepID=A0A9Q0JUS9_9MAGN|nr:hypothetical protein NE237_030371 [Protea cynaroides]
MLQSPTTDRLALQTVSHSIIAIEMCERYYDLVVQWYCGTIVGYELAVQRYYCWRYNGISVGYELAVQQYYCWTSRATNSSLLLVFPIASKGYLQNRSSKIIAAVLNLCYLLHSQMIAFLVPCSTS